MLQPGDVRASSQASQDSPAPPTRIPRIVTLVLLSALLLAVLVGIDLLVLSRNNPAQALSPHYYMALGDSLSFGYQPNLDFSSGFADDIFNDLRPANVTNIVNYACAGETTATMIHGNCQGKILHHGSYAGSQLQAAIDFLEDPAHAGRVSPITLEIGSNDVLPDWNQATCMATTSVDADLAAMDKNLTETILPQLLNALGTPKSAHNGDLHLLNYYNPFAKECPDSTPFADELNTHLAADAAMFQIPVVDVYTQFGGYTKTADNICSLTWICNAQFHDVHPTNEGYAQIADAVEQTLGLPGQGPLQPIVPPASGNIAPSLAFLRRVGVNG